MKLAKILKEFNFGRTSKPEIIGNPKGVVVKGLSYDSRKVKEGDLFFCISGERNDGHDYAQEAIANGATAVIVDRKIQTDSPQIKVENVRSAMAEIAEIFFNFPSRKLTTVGVTGTNGKTTTVNLLAEIATSAGENVASIGTLTGIRTTPEAPDLQKQIHDLTEEGKSFLAMEVSSHGLSQRRISNIKYDLAIFTNLSHDHLDYHGDMESYYKAKSILFTPNHAKYAVINVDTPFGKRLAEEIEIPHKTVSMGDVEIIEESIQQNIFQWEGETIEMQTPGTFNIENAISAAFAAEALGFDKESIVKGLSEAQALPGRFEVINSKNNGPTVIIDYSHTPDGLRKVLLSAQNIPGVKNVHVVFGCGGDRDKSKRSQMGAASENAATDVYLTSDNPRSEDERSIINDVLAGFRNPADVYIELDRRKAIFQAIKMSDPKDVVIIAGKGNEESQEIKGQFHPFKDSEVALDGLEARAT